MNVLATTSPHCSHSENEMWALPGAHPPGVVHKGGGAHSLCNLLPTLQHQLRNGNCFVKHPPCTPKKMLASRQYRIGGGWPQPLQRHLYSFQACQETNCHKLPAESMLGASAMSSRSAATGHACFTQDSDGTRQTQAIASQLQQGNTGPQQGAACSSSRTGGRATWVVAQVNDVALHTPVLSHADGVGEGTCAL